jgi:hypothetical protein
MAITKYNRLVGKEILHTITITKTMHGMTAIKRGSRNEMRRKEY